MDITHIIIYTVATAAVLAFVLLSYKDALLLVRRPATLGTGFGRIWAVSRMTVAEAWAAKAWAVPIIWFVACGIICLLSRAFEAPIERIDLYLHVLLRGQIFVCMVLLGVMACYSFPRERERRTIITTASKPLSRLEYFLGKVTGFCMVALLLLGIMTAVTWVFMLGTNEYVKSTARADLAHEQQEYDAGERGSEPPSPALRRAAAEGELHAYDYITAENLQVAGGIDYGSEPPELLIKGGSQQYATYTLGMSSSDARSRTGLAGIPASVVKTPFFFFHFGYLGHPQANEIPKITVFARLADDPTVSEQRTISLGTPSSALGYASWSVDDPAKFFWYEGGMDPGPVLLNVSCDSPDIYLRVYTGNDPNSKNVDAVDLDGARIPGGAEQLAAIGVPEVRGFERGDTQQIEGPKASDLRLGLPSEVASFRFRNVKLGDVPLDKDGNFTISLRLDEDRMGTKSGTVGELRAYRIFYPGEPFVEQFTVDQKRVVEIKAPSSLLDKTGMDLVVDIRCLTPNHWIGTPADGVRLDRAPSFFLLNLLKSESVIFMECALLVFIGVTCSLRLGWPVAMLVTAVCYLLGNMFGFVSYLMSEHGYSLLTYAEAKDLKGTLFYEIGTGLMNASVHMLYFFVNALPDFTRFDAVKYIVGSRTMPWTDLLDMLGWFGLYALPCVAIGYLLIRKQELA